jgi:DivIVA domain-containing protein
VENTRFQATKFREGYDQDEVDDFLDRVVATLRGDGVDPVRLRADEVRTIRFQATKFRDGYDQDEVDRFLDDIVLELRRREGHRPG